jgi:hypothetical protein
MDSLVNIHPKDWLLTYGPKKRLVDKYHWHLPDVGIIASYTPNEHDVEDHFDIFRGVDQVESFAQATVVSCGSFLECKKLGVTPQELADMLVPAFVSIGNVNFRSYLQKGQTFVNIGIIKFYKFRQMICEGRIYKVPEGLDLDAYFKDFTGEQLLSYDLGPDFILIAELYDITGRGIKKETFAKLQQQ